MVNIVLRMSQILCNVQISLNIRYNLFSLSLVVCRRNIDKSTRPAPKSGNRLVFIAVRRFCQSTCCQEKKMSSSTFALPRTQVVRRQGQYLKFIPFTITIYNFCGSWLNMWKRSDKARGEKHENSVYVCFE